MVHINIWFVPRTRSTALTKCLSNIPDSKVFFEYIVWAFYLGDEDSIYTNNREQLGDLSQIPIVPGYNTNSAIKSVTEDTSKVKIVKDFIYVFDGREKEVIAKDSVNIFLVRDPEYVFTSFLPTAKQYFYYVSKAVHPDISFSYQKISKGIEIVTKICEKPPMIIDSALLSTKDGSVKVVKAICEKAGVEFTESMLTWESTEGLNPNWISPGVATSAHLATGFFSRANSSTSFEDAKERTVDMEELAKEHPEMIEDIKACKPYFQKIMDLPFVLKL